MAAIVDCQLQPKDCWKPDCKDPLVQISLYLVNGFICVVC